MDLGFTPEQEMIRDSLGRYLAQSYTLDDRRAIIASDHGLSDAAWSQFVAMGLVALPLSQAAGGLGGTAMDLVAVGEIMGRHLVVEPWLSSSVLCGDLMGQAGAAPWQARLAQGQARAALAYDEGHGTVDPAAIAMTARADGDGYVLNGHKRLVLGAAQADVLLVAARCEDGTIGLFLMPPATPGLTMQDYATIDGRRAAHCRFDAVRLGAEAKVLPDAAGALRDRLHIATLVLCADAVGAMGALLDASATHAATRRQFGMPIAGFQAIAHRLADMKMAYVQAHSLLMVTAALATAGTMQRRDLAVLKAQVGAMGQAIGESAIQIHGGVGTTDELAVGHHAKRVLFANAMWGDSHYHFAMIARAGLQSVDARP